MSLLLDAFGHRVAHRIAHGEDHVRTSLDDRLQVAGIALAVPAAEHGQAIVGRLVEGQLSWVRIVVPAGQQLGRERVGQDRARRAHSQNPGDLLRYDDGAARHVGHHALVAARRRAGRMPAGAAGKREKHNQRYKPLFRHDCLNSSVSIHSGNHNLHAEPAIDNAQRDFIGLFQRGLGQRILRAVDGQNSPFFHQRHPGGA